MTDRELLELAARAAGVKVPEQGPWSGVDPMFGGVYTLNMDGTKFESKWNPLTDDGEALRLAVKLQISVTQNIIRVEASTIQLTLDRVFIHEDTLNQDANIATRRAIVRAAAEIGKGK